MQKEMFQTLRGWGVWLESVEITDVRICSKSLFEDMQAEFRQEQHLKAEQIRLANSKTLEEEKANHDIQVAKLRTEKELRISQLESQKSLSIAKNTADQDSAKRLYEAEQKLKLEEKQSLIDEQKAKLDMIKFERQAKIDKDRAEITHQIAVDRVNKEIELETMRHSASLKRTREQLEVEREMTPENLKKAVLDATIRIYEKLPIRDIKLNNYLTPTSKSSDLGGLLPGFSALAHEWAEVASPQTDK
jgi:hypothetical protein